MSLFFFARLPDTPVTPGRWWLCKRGPYATHAARVPSLQLCDIAAAACRGSHTQVFFFRLANIRSIVPAHDNHDLAISGDDAQLPTMAKCMCSVNDWIVCVLLVVACVCLDSGAFALPGGADKIAAGTRLLRSTDDGTTDTDTTQAADQREVRDMGETDSPSTQVCSLGHKRGGLDLSDLLFVQSRQGKNMRGSMVNDQGSGSGQLPAPALDADALREDLRASWPEFKPTTAARKFKSWRDVNKQLQPVLQTKDGSIRCWSDDDPRRLPRCVHTM